jgi:hypothetical protein
VIPHGLIEDFKSYLERHYIWYWRIYVTIGVTIFFFFIGRALIYIISPMFSINFGNNNANVNNRKNKGIIVKDDKK